MDNGAQCYRRFLDGDEKAFGEIIALYADNLIFFLDRYIHNPAISQELSEDVFVELLIHRHRYNFKTSLKTYLFTIGRNKAIDYIRRVARHPECAYDALPEIGDTLRLEDEFIRDEEHRALHEAIAELPDDYKTVLHLIYFEDMSTAQTARVMKKSIKQIENLSYRAKKSLRKILEQKEVGSYENK